MYLETETMPSYSGIDIGKPVFGTPGAPPVMPAVKPVKPIPPMLAKVRAEFVRKNIAIVRELQAKGLKDEEIFASVTSFAEGFPGLFKKLLENHSSSNIFIEQTLSMLDKMAAEEMTQHEASVAIGQISYDAQVKPKIDSMGGDKPKKYLK